ncbi:MAG: hypothetical protein GY856_54060, partial [bacterium]|nr:hypothetical protein [bacterium]
MKKFLRKALKVSAIVGIVLVVVLVATGFWFVRRPWPQVEGTIVEAGL